MQTCQIHRQLPPGGILVFVTGQREVENLCKRLRASLGSADSAALPIVEHRMSQDVQTGDEVGLVDRFGEDAADAAPGEAQRHLEGMQRLFQIWLGCLFSVFCQFHCLL